jgi:TRADD-N domain-containing protein
VRLAEVVTDTKEPGRPPSLSTHREVMSGEGTPVPAAALISLPLILIAAAAAVGGVALARSGASGWLSPAAFVTSAFFFLSGAVVPLGIIRENGVEKAEKENCQTDCEDLYWALHCIGNPTLKGLAWVNFKQLRTFTVIAQKQARISYYASLTAAAVSLLVLVAGSAVAIGSPTTPAKATAGALATVGTVLSGFLARTFLRSYQMTSLQMSYYYGQPLVHCYLLHAEWLASEGCRDLDDAHELRLREKVIDASLKAAADAQSHLLSMQMPEPRGRGIRLGRNKAKPPE